MLLLMQLKLGNSGRGNLVSICSLGGAVHISFTKLPTVFTVLLKSLCCFAIAVSVLMDLMLMLLLLSLLSLLSYLLC